MRAPLWGLLLGMMMAWPALPALARDEAPRTVVIGGDIAEIIVALGAADSLVGRDDTSLYPPSLLQLPSVGYLRRLAAEGVLSLRPERLIVADQAGPGEVLAQLEASGVHVIRIGGFSDIESIPAKVMAVANALKVSGRGQEMAQAVQEEIERLDALPTLPATPAMFLLSHSGMTPMVAGQGTAAQAAMDAVGIDNAFHSLSGYKSVNAEALVQLAPQVVIVTRSGLEALGGEAGLWQLPGLAMTPAGRARRLVVCDDQALLGFGPRTPAALLELHGALQELGMSSTLVKSPPSHSEAVL